MCCVGNYLPLFTSQPAAELNPLNTFLGFAGRHCCSAPFSGLSAAAVPQGLAGIMPERFPSLPRTQGPSTDESDVSRSVE